MKIKFTGSLFALAKRVVPPKVGSVFLLVCTCVFSLAIKVSAQDANISIPETRQYSTTQVFDLIKKQTNYTFVYRSDLFNGQPSVNISEGYIKTADLLKLSLGDKFSYEYSAEDNSIVITPRPADKENLQSGASHNQVHQVSGVVGEESGETLAGVSVIIQGEGRGTITDANGRYTLNAPSNKNLIYSFLGYERVELPVGNRTEMNVTLKESLTTLSEVTVVSTGYQKIDPNKVTGSYELISSVDLQESPSIDIIDRLQGKVPGVRFDAVNNTVSIRGPNTFYTSSAPLIVIDGFPAIDQSLSATPGTDFNNIGKTSNNSVLSTFNINDIESISFLKDASAASIWGSRAANGVIVITTKKGKKNSAPVFNFSATATYAKPSNLDDLNRMSSKEYIDFETELFDNNFFPDPYSAWRYQNGSQASNYMFQAQRGEITEAELDARINELSQVNNNDQIEEYLLQPSVTQQYNLSINGGSDNSTYYVSGNYSSNRPSFKSNWSEQYAITANYNTSFFNDKVSLQTGINHTYSTDEVNTGAIASISEGPFGLRPYDLLVDENGNAIDRDILFTSDVIEDFESQGYLPWSYNSIDELDNSSSTFNKNRTRINAMLSGDITSWAKLSVSGMLQRNSTEVVEYYDEDSYEMRSLINEGTTINEATGQLVYGVPVGGRYEAGNTFTSDYTMRAQLDIDKNWNNIHQLTAIAGTEIRQSKGRGYNMVRYGYDKESSTTVVVNPTTPYATIYGSTATLTGFDRSIYRSINRYLSYYGNASYSYLQKYFISGSIRFDDTNMIGVDKRNRAIPLWSTGLRWNAKAEDFLINVNWLSLLNVRTSYGTGGSSPANNTGVLRTLYTVGGTDYYSGLPYGYIGSPGNRDFGWETTKTLNAGFEIGVFDSRINLSFDIYKKWSKGILANVPYNGTYGWTNLTYNTGDMESNGYELAINAYPIKTRDFSWLTNFNISYNTNEVTDSRFDDNVALAENFISSGNPVDNLMVYKWAGLDETGQSQVYDEDGNIVPSTDFEVTGNDLVYAGRTTPTHFGGFTNTFRYKNLSLLVRITYDMGHKALKRDISTSYYPTSGYFSDFLGTSKKLTERWREEGDEAFTDVPGILNSNTNSINRYKQADINVIDADNIRLAQVSLSYILPSAAIAKIKYIRSATITASANNLGPIWVKNDEGIDPLYIFQGSYSSLAPAANYSLGLNISF